MTMTIANETTRAHSEADVERALSFADAGNALAGNVATEESKEITRQFLRGEISEAEMVDSIARLAKLPAAND